MFGKDGYWKGLVRDMFGLEFDLYIDLVFKLLNIFFRLLLFCEFLSDGSVGWWNWVIVSCWIFFGFNIDMD